MQASQYQIFSLPHELLESLTPRNLVNRVPSRTSTPEPAVTTSKSGPRACAICNGVLFLDVDEQRAHFRSDWHRYNVKTRLNGGKTVSEVAFSQLVEGLEDSLSGSESSDENNDEDSDAVNTLVNKTKHLTNRSPTPDSSSKNLPITALMWFHSPPSTQLGIYRAILPLQIEPIHYLDELKKLQRNQPEGRIWAVFMVAGGHFAGAVIRVSQGEDHFSEDERERNRKKKPKKPKPDTEVLLHKTFHRYTTRRKQGGSQSTNDNAKGPAKSAGAQLRRYGEQALREDIRGLLEEWKEDIVGCERIWIRASTSNRKIFTDYEEAPFNNRDERLRTFPFPTRRPTQSELTRCLAELTRPKISHFTEEELRAQDDAYLASLPKPRAVPTVVQPAPEKPKQPKLSNEEEALREKWNRLLEMINKGRLEPLKAFLDREDAVFGGVDARVPEWTGEKRATILQMAVQSGHEDMVRWLLEEARADPTIPVPSSKAGDLEDADEGGNKSDASDGTLALPPGSRRVAYDLSRTKPIRDIFRRCAAAHPDWWDWFGAAHLPSALSQEMEDERDEKKKEWRKGLKDRVKGREAREKEKEKDKPKIPPVEIKPIVKDISSLNSTSRRLGGGSGAAEGTIGLTLEMRAKVERERRARAAEARMKGLGGG